MQFQYRHVENAIPQAARAAAARTAADLGAQLGRVRLDAARSVKTGHEKEVSIIDKIS